MKTRSSRHIKSEQYPFLAIHRDDEDSGFIPCFQPSVLLITHKDTGVVVSPGTEYRFGSLGDIWKGTDAFLVKYNGRVTLSNY